ncbi:hypothetical protein [Kamptonema formosum]|uniref:hypothetical protein n=1 Tax=Kamptonema formosum TaxID=331992 RepID=UPI00034B856D|nr:hypothetical protein [Oscillatoria sp. PCC 10802]
MKSRVLIVFLTAILTASCTPPAPTNPPKQVNQTWNLAAWTSRPTSQLNAGPTGTLAQPGDEFLGSSFPKKSCRESFPEEPSAYPVEFYPVFLSEKISLNLVRSKFCQDASYRLNGSRSILVGSIIGKERAEQLHKLLQKEFGSAEVGEPTVIKTKPPSSQSVANAAQLTSEQVEQLIALDKNNAQGIDVKIIVPTYIPAGFQAYRVEAEDGHFGPNYSVTYRNYSNNTCFTMTGASGGFGAEPTNYQTVEVNSPALGRVTIEYTNFNQTFKRPYIGFKDFETAIVEGSQLYLFSPYNSRTDGCSNIISFQEAVKVVESLQYLNP